MTDEGTKLVQLMLYVQCYLAGLLMGMALAAWLLLRPMKRRKR